MYPSPARPFFFAFAALLLASHAAPIAHAQETGLRGADAVLREFAKLQAQAAPAGTPAPVPADLETQLKKLRGAIAQFAAQPKPLPVKEAAGGWLALLERWKMLAEAPHSTSVSQTTLPSFRALVLALPQPEAWPLVIEGLRHANSGHPSPVQALLETFAAVLGNDDAALDGSLKALRGFSSTDPYLGQTVSQLEAQLLASTDNPAIVSELFRAQFLPQGADSAARSGTTVAVPDLVELEGEDKAGGLLREALQQPVVLDVSHAGNRTAALARKLALERVDDLRAPQWKLAQSVDADALFQALDQRFGAGSASGQWAYDAQSARTFHLVSLLMGGRIDDAVAFAQSAKSAQTGRHYIDYQAVRALRSAGKSKEVFEFLGKLIATDPALPDWSSYVSLAADIGKLDEVVQLAEDAARQPSLPAAAREAISHKLASAYLAADRIDDGIRTLRTALAAPPEPATGDDSADSEPMDIGIQLGNVGWALHRPDLTDEGIRAAKAWFLSKANEPVGTGLSHVSSYRAGELATLLEDTGRAAGAEEVLQAQLLADGRSQLESQRLLEAQAAKHTMDFGYLRYRMQDSIQPAVRDDLAALAGFYGRQHRPADVLTLLDRATGWRAKDLGEILSTRTSAGASLGYVAAQAMDDLGRAAEARRVLGALLDAGSDYDPAYDLFLRLTPPEEAAIAFDRVFARDRFQERPLIWKAEALGRMGRLDEAESVARAAIAVDPSDGEEGRGRRMRAYTTLADILAARGEDPEPYRSAVRAIRLSEDADGFYRAGLLSRAIPLYRQALGIFSDAYCIQSRLAVQLADIGEIDEAEKHYQRAFELMPSSFGRVESHCFGCEGVFSGQQAQGIADRVFTHLASLPHASPQVFYLLGYLRFEEDRYPESLDATRRAVARDPDYLNAWKRISDDLASHLQIPRPELDGALLNIVRLDPNRRHAHPELDRIRDLSRLWKAALDIEPELAPVHPACYPLAASRASELARQEKIATLARSNPMDTDASETMWPSFGDRTGPLPSAPELVARQGMVSLLIRALDNASHMR